MTRFSALFAILALLASVATASAQPGPGPMPDPWTVNGAVISYPGAVLVGTPTGGQQGAGSLNAQALYVNGVAVTSGSGSVANVSVVSANGFSGTVANATSTPAITIRTTINGIMKGNGTSASAAISGSDYLAPGGNGSGLTGLTWSQIFSTPTTLAGYGITNGLTTALPSTQIIVGNGSNLAGLVTMSGDATLANTGAVSVNHLTHVTDGSLANSGLTNSSITIAGHSVSLGGTQGIAYADLSSGAPIMTASVGGLVPTPPNNTTTYLRGDGTFASITSGTVTSVSVATANGFSGTVANSTSTPAITIRTSATGILQGNGTAISAVTLGTGLNFSGGTLSALNGVQFVSGNYPIAQSDNQSIIEFNCSGACQLQLGGGFIVGTMVNLVQTGTVAIAITPTGGASVYSQGGQIGSGGYTHSNGSFTGFTCYYRASSSWLCLGPLAP